MTITVSKIVYASALDGWIYGDNATYATARSTSTDVDIAQTYFRVGQSTSAGGTDRVRRGYISFDTSCLPNDATVTAATLYVKMGTSAITANDFNVDVYRYAWTAPLGTDREVDYDGAYGSGVSEGTLIATASWSENGWASLALDAAEISKTGASRYALVSSRDVAGTAPGASENEYVNFNGARATGVSSDPYLSVTYTVRSRSGVVSVDPLMTMV
jgi:hypothetical protein